MKLIVCVVCFVEGRKKTKDAKGDKKKRSGNSSEEDSAGGNRTNKKKKQKGAGSSTPGSGTTASAKAASGDGLYFSYGLTIIYLTRNISHLGKHNLKIFTNKFTWMCH